MAADLAPLFRQLTVGVYVIGVVHGSRRDAFTAASVMQISYAPLLILVGVNPEHAAYRLMRGGSVFSVNVLKIEQLSLARHFGPRHGAVEDKLAGQRWHPGRRGAPILDDALAFFECETVGEWPAGDHRIILGEAIDGATTDGDALPLTYAATGDMDGSRALYPPHFPHPTLPGN
jgi:flavin reductase (DIM6/NTAB) family NADH-FMN oxidoreductase RutF